jgi:hypothetical protein
MLQRRKTNAKRIAAMRRFASALADRAIACRVSALADRARVLVLCPIRRELQLGLFTSARDSFVEAGFPVSAVRRFQGIDLQNNRLRDGVQSANAVVTKSFLREFVPKARAIWSTCPRVAYVFFAEDDCRFLPGVDVEAVLREAKAPGRCADWLGYGLRNGQPKGGAHLLSFTKVGLERFVKDLKPFVKQRALVLDTALHHLWLVGRIFVLLNILPCRRLAEAPPLTLHYMMSALAEKWLIRSCLSTAIDLQK